jgi:hypothetical protein
MSAVRVSVSEPLCSTNVSTPDQPRIVFTRQLWQRTMPLDSGRRSSNQDPRVSVDSDFQTGEIDDSVFDTGSPTTYRSLGNPLTPEESPPFQTVQKRHLDQVIEDQRESSTPSHSRESSDGSNFQPCLCQPGPKVPRPRNAFILYRQHHNTSVVARHPGLANPKISKIIGELWNNEPEEERQRWRGYAEVGEILRMDRTYG